MGVRGLGAGGRGVGRVGVKGRVEPTTVGCGDVLRQARRYWASAHPHRANSEYHCGVGRAWGYWSGPQRQNATARELAR